MTTKTDAKVQPISFDSRFIRAIRDGRKTQTRRPVKPQTQCSVFDEPQVCWLRGQEGVWCDGHGNQHRCPYGEVGDLLWVRETWAVEPSLNYLPAEELECNGTRTERGGLAATIPVRRSEYPSWEPWDGTKWRDSREMPQWASDLTIEVAGVRVERLHEITEDEAIAEGVTVPSQFSGVSSSGEPIENPHGDMSPTDVFADLWREFYGCDSWGTNPWVWVIDFRVSTKME